MPPALLVVAVVTLGFAASWMLTGWVLGYARRTRMLDAPNERTLHQGEVPRGGGLAIVVVLLVCQALLTLVYTDRGTLLTLMGVTAGLGALGWLDDRRGLGPFVKIGAQLVIAVFAVGQIGELSGVTIAGLELGFGALAAVLTVLWVVWMTNAYNFMDGIDGIAAGHTAVVGCVMGAWFALDGNGAMALLCYAIMAAALGFLVWNWSPARVFMGDVGSVTLGGVFGVLVIVGNIQDGVPLTAYVILFGVFLYDTLVTLVRRLLRGKVVWLPHREHYYQRATTTGLGHAVVSVVVVVSTVVMAVLASLEKYGVGPEGTWLVLALLLLTGLAAVVVLRERSRP